MSKHRLYQIRDVVAQLVRGIIIASNRDEAVIRQFTEVLGQTDTDLGKYPRDYELIYLGDQETETGEITPSVPPKIIYTGAIWKRLTERLNADARTPANDNTAGVQAPALVKDA